MIESGEEMTTIVGILMTDTAVRKAMEENSATEYYCMRQGIMEHVMKRHR